MVSGKLIRLIEEHWESLAARILKQMHADARLSHVSALAESELHERARDILEHLGHWLTPSSEHELAERFELIGGRRHEEGIPLDEVVLSYLILKDRMLEFVRGQGLSQSTLEVYAEGELEHSVGRFFDSMTYHVVRGYCAALEHAHHHGHAKSTAGPHH